MNHLPETRMNGSGHWVMTHEEGSYSSGSGGYCREEHGELGRSLLSLLSSACYTRRLQDFSIMTRITEYLLLTRKEIIVERCNSSRLCTVAF